MKVLISSILLLIQCSIGQTQVLSHLNIGFFTGFNHPRGRLSKALNTQPTFGLRISSPYYNSLFCHSTIQYTWLYGDNLPRDLHFIKLAVGMAWQSKTPWLPRLGVEFSSFTIRATYREHHDKFLLDEFESEFGGGGFAHWVFYQTKFFSLLFGVDWDVVFSQPEYSHFASIQGGLDWRLW